MQIVDLLQKHGIPYREAGSHHHVTRGWLGIDCPFCSPNAGRFRMGYNLAGAFFSCWTCGSHSAWMTLQQLLPLPNGQVYEVMKSLDREIILEDRPTGKLKLPPGITALAEQHKSYLTGRGFDPDELVRLWHLQGTKSDSTHPWRIVIPIYSRGMVVSWTTRAVRDDVDKRYKAAPAACEAISAKTLLYGEDHARNAVVVCEGPADVWRIGPGAVATLGVSYTNEQVTRMSRYPVRVVCFDREPQAQRRANALCRELECFPGSTYNVVLSAKDPGSAGRREVGELRGKFLDS